MVTSQIQFFLSTYKGHYVRLYLRNDGFCQGILVSSWRKNFVMMVNGPKGFMFRYIPYDQISFIYPCKGLSTNQPSYIPKMVYGSKN